MMTTKYIIGIEHHKAIGTDDIVYYRGEGGGACVEETVPILDYRKKLAKRYNFEHEAIHDMRILQARFSKYDIFKVIPIRCKA